VFKWCKDTKIKGLFLGKRVLNSVKMNVFQIIENPDRDSAENRINQQKMALKFA